VVLHEVCYILGSKSHYGKTVPEIIGRMQTVLGWPGLQFPGSDRESYLRAFEIWAEHPDLEFSDSVIAARCERAGHELATFDRHFADLPFLQLWRPETTSTNET
ncbi:MAG: PIN domain-containing protein, partial [Thermomicrobiales bacterium]